MIEYRPFHNSDPPRIAALWNDAGLGRGAVHDINSDILEQLVFAQPYFDRHGLIVAWEDSRAVGFIHASFGAKADETELDHELGVICAVMVHPEFRRRGIGRELVSQAQEYLKASGATSINAGPAPPRDPFYCGVYGGSALAGFLESDPAAGPFFEALGYEPIERRPVFQCDLNKDSLPVSVRLMEIRRRMELRVIPQPEPLTWWWTTRYGRLESLRFLLCPKTNAAPVAAVTVVGLDHYQATWQVQAIGLTDLTVPDSEWRKGFGQALVLAVIRRLRDELFTRVECHAPEDNLPAVGLLKSCGFEQIDAGVVYQRETDWTPVSPDQPAANAGHGDVTFHTSDG